MKELNHRGLQEDFYKIVANNLEIRLHEEEKAIIVYESFEPLHSTTYHYKTNEERNQDLDELLKYKQ
jgi:hypothetical protein